MKDKIAGIIFIPLILLPITYVVFNVIKIIAMILFPGQIFVSEYIQEIGDGFWVIDPDKDLWGIFVVWIIICLIALIKLRSQDENK